MTMKPFTMKKKKPKTQEPKSPPPMAASVSFLTNEERIIELLEKIEYNTAGVGDPRKFGGSKKFEDTGPL